MTSKHFVELRSGRRAGQIAEFPASPFSSSTARLASCHAALPWLFKLFWSPEPFLWGTHCCKFHIPRMPSLSVTAAGWAHSSLRDLHLMLPCRRVADTAHQHFTLQHVQQAMLHHQELIPPFSAISTVNCWQLSKTYFEVKEIRHFKVINNWPFEKSIFSITAVTHLQLVGGCAKWTCWHWLLWVQSTKLLSGSLNHCLWCSW